MITLEKAKTISINKLGSEQEGVSLLERSKLRSMFAMAIAKQTLSNPDKQIIRSIEISSLLLDIGKLCDQFQKELNSSKKEKKKIKFLYNEIGWAFLSKYLNGKNNEFVLDCIYWNNGITTNKNKKMCGYNNNNVLDTINEKDKSEMKKFLKEALSETSIEIISNDVKQDAPTYYSKSDVIGNAKKTFIRSCIISADRLVSSLKPTKLAEILQTKDINSVSHLISNLTQRNYNNSANLNNEKQISFDNYNPSRLNIQKDIVESCDKTTIVNAPSGFGKCLVGLLWNILKSDKKMIWVCPRNAVAQAVYVNILNELKSLGIINELSVELYLTSERKKTNVNYFVEEFNSDIIITNIDNFLSPSINMNNSERLFFINNCDVVFDEYHELVRDEALFAGFVNIMNVRNRFTNSRTILLSATPLKTNNLWDNGINLKTKILPNENAHYPSAHKKNYGLYTYSYDSIESFNTRQKISSVAVFNSISNSQIIHYQVNSGKLIHSKFSEKDKDEIFDFMYEEFGKDSSRFMSKENITATHVIQASLDISFQNLYESVLSPLSTLQRIGRCDRWGDYGNESKISIYKINDKGENKMKELLYTTNLSDKWFDYITKYDKKQINLDKLYEIYNEFHKINSTEINKYIENCHDKSLLSFVKIFPKHSSSIKSKENKTFRAGSNKLRSSSNEIFSICKVHNSTKYSDIVSDKTYSNFRDFDEDGKTFGRMTKAMKSIRDMKDERYDYTDLIEDKDLWDINILRDAAKESITPYIRFDVVYLSGYGIIKKSILNQINKQKNQK